MQAKKCDQMKSMLIKKEDNVMLMYPSLKDNHKLGNYLDKKWKKK